MQPCKTNIACAGSKQEPARLEGRLEASRSQHNLTLNQMPASVTQRLAASGPGVQLVQVNMHPLPVSVQLATAREAYPQMSHLWRLRLSIQ